MTMLGMDTQAGLAASQQLESGATDITALASRLDSALQAFDWFGPDADRTRDEWAASGRPTLDSTAQHLARLAVQIRAEAQQQDTASEATGDTASATGTTSSGGVLGFLKSVGTFVTSRISAAFQGLGHVATQEMGLVSKVADVLTGTKDWPVSAIAASAVATLGSEAGVVANLVTGKDQNWFGEGPGLAGTPVAVPTDASGATQFQPALTQPTDLPSLMQGVSDGYQVGQAPGSDGDIRITKVDNGDGNPAYVVAVPGTERWYPDAGGVERDLSANVNLVAGNPTAAVESVQRAMDAAGVPPGANVLLVGHSQGGIIAGQLASDPSFVSRYGSVNLMTYASPIDQDQLVPGVNALQIAHGNDLVPKLDLGGVDVDGVDPNTPVTSVTLPSPGGPLDLATNHSYALYHDDVATALGSSTQAGATLRSFQSSLSPFFVQPGGHATAVDVPVSRGR